MTAPKGSGGPPAEPPDGYHVWNFYDESPEHDGEDWMWAADGSVFDRDTQDWTREQAIAACWEHRRRVCESEPAPPTDGPTLGEVVDEACAVLARHGWVCGGATMIEAVDNACSSGLVAARRAQRLQDEADALRDRVRVLEHVVKQARALCVLAKATDAPNTMSSSRVQQAINALDRATTQEPPAKEQDA